MKKSLLKNSKIFLFKFSYLKYILLIPGIFFPFMEASSQDYFQQKVNYDIHVTLNDLKHELRGSESVEYINNSPDTLGFIY